MRRYSSSSMKASYKLWYACTCTYVIKLCGAIIFQFAEFSEEENIYWKKLNMAQTNLFYVLFSKKCVHRSCPPLVDVELNIKSVPTKVKHKFKIPLRCIVQ